jgi:hypothetical protein
MSPATALPTQPCNDCGFAFPLGRTNCPRCARPQLFPNVAIAGSPAETAKLDHALQLALADASARGCDTQLSDFSDACKGSTVVFRCNINRLHRQIASGTDIFETYYYLERLRLRTETHSALDYEQLRPQAEVELLGNEKFVGQIHYAALSLDGNGISTYGNCIVQLSEPLIAHRATCFEGNTAVLYNEEANFSERLRSIWEDRHKLCTSVMAASVDSATASTDHASILVQPGPKPEEDVFIEVHVFGDMTAGTFAAVHFAEATPSSRDRVYWEAVEEKLAQAGVSASTP